MHPAAFTSGLKEKQHTSKIYFCHHWRFLLWDRTTLLINFLFKPQIRPSSCRRSRRHPSHDCCWCKHWRFLNSRHLENKHTHTHKIRTLIWPHKAEILIKIFHLDSLRSSCTGLWFHFRRLTAADSDKMAILSPRHLQVPQRTSLHQQHLTQQHHFPLSYPVLTPAVACTLQHRVT